MNSHTASDPNRNITVSASAGTGKTYLLVSRIIRLLVDGAIPGNILALTFTRKAAGEMRERLQQQLVQLALAKETDLPQQLIALGIEPNDQNRQTSRRIYEAVLFAEQPIRLSTFHAFCQELLQRFPMEADIPPGFELLESTALIQEQAWDALFKQATESPNSALSQALELLFAACNGLNNTQDALMSGFLAHRSDWWAFTQGQKDPVEYATNILLTRLNLSEHPCEEFIKQYKPPLQAFQALLQKHPTAGNLKFAQQLESGLCHATADDGFAMIIDVFLTQTLEPRKRAINKTLIAKMGNDGAERFIQLHETLCDAVLNTHNEQLNLIAFKTNRAWYLSGHHLLSHYQRIKREQRLLDFADLEWKSYELLHNSDNALWVQYKLDQKIDHLLVDEFQDTNPTQWQLILPLLQEIASQESERKRSVFLVGDPKQSIYSFRRANPELQSSASLWLQDNLNAQDIPLTASWRSSPAIIEFVNQVFANSPINRYIKDFKPHSTHLKSLWGHVEVLPLQFEAQQPTEQAIHFRNPLLEPRQRYSESTYYAEGRLIADKIKQLFADNITIEDAGISRAIQYRDIYILFRNRTHLADYELALADANIPFIGNKPDDLLDSLEIKDMLALLNVITAPFNNLALAQVLRSPLFYASDEDLIQLASESSGENWLQGLHTLVDNKTASKTLIRAYQLLTRWQAEAKQLPTHDLLDRIYTQGEVFARYRACTPPAQQQNVHNNLIRFIEMALEVDSGRYPSTIKFLARLKQLKQAQYDTSSTPEITSKDSSVRLLTIHAAKGLEAPIVFLADSASVPKPKLSYKAIVDWPASKQRPTQFFLSTNKESLPNALKEIIDKQLEAEQKEAANLLYVALTRARHALFISGSSKSEPATQTSWYHLLSSQTSDSNQACEQIKCRYGTPGSALPASADTNIGQKPQLDDHLFVPLHYETKTKLHKHQHDSIAANEARLKGILIHDYLNKLSSANSIKNVSALNSYLESAYSQQTIASCKQEAWDTFHNQHLDFIFNPQKSLHRYHEVPILYQDEQNAQAYGVIDRLVVCKDIVWVIDYKTEPLISSELAESQAAMHREQLRRYALGVKKIWPTQKIQCGILFTAQQHLERLDII